MRLVSLVLWFLAVGVMPLSAQTPAGQPYTWRGVAIGGGGFVSGIVFHPTERGLVYARTDVSGAFRWDIPRQEWIPLNYDIGGLNNEFMRLGVLSLAVDPADPDRVYLACGQYVEWWASTAVILRSEDRGATWQRTELPFRVGGNQDGRSTGERLVVDPNNSDVLYLGTNLNGLWRSTDRGATWSQVTSFTPTSCTLVLVDPSSGAGGTSQTIYVGVNSTTGASLYRSTDAGATWAAVPGQPSGLMPHHADFGSAAGSRHLFLAYSNGLGPNGITAGAVWRLDLTAGAWTNITPLSGTFGYAGLSVDASSPSTLVTSTIDRWWPGDEIYRSTDGGTTWSPILSTGTRDHSQAPWAASGTPHWTGDVKIDPFDSARAMFVTGYGIFESGNLGAATTAWRFFNEGLEETAPLGIISPPTGAPLISTLGDIDGFRHDDLRTEPALRHTPMQGTNRGLDFAENLAAKMVRTFDGGTRGAYSLDGGSTWAAFPTAASASANGGAIAISADGATIVWSQDNTAARRSTTDGTSWTACTGAPSGGTFAPVADRANASKFYIYNQNTGALHVSTDAGATFTTAATLPTGAARLRAVPGFEGHLWIPCWSSGLRRSIDSGASFSAVSSVQEGYAVGFGRAAPGQSHPAVFLWGKVGGVVGLFRSDDTGATWVRINDDRHQFGYIGMITGDPRVFGRVYVA
ncbi:MAG: carbohydrate-binding protein, partial [Opitutaceae bacterium]|nr:carbohydrate-binding protein [Opitutaceae bacterium]